MQVDDANEFAPYGESGGIKHLGHGISKTIRRGSGEVPVKVRSHEPKTFLIFEESGECRVVRIRSGTRRGQNLADLFVNSNSISHKPT